MATRPDDRYSRPRNWHRTSSAGSRTSRSRPIANPGPCGWVAGDGGTSRWFSRLAALLIAAVVALAISTTLIEREQKQTEAQHRRAEDNFQLAFHAVDRMLREVGETELADVPQMEPVRRQLLKDACQFYQKLLQQPGRRSRTLARNRSGTQPPG